MRWAFAIATILFLTNVASARNCHTLRDPFGDDLVFCEDGEESFRHLETKLLCELDLLAVRPARAVVFATGGGLPVYNDNMSRLLALGKVVALDADIPVLVKRLLGD